MDVLVDFGRVGFFGEGAEVSYADFLAGAEGLLDGVKDGRYDAVGFAAGEGVFFLDYGF